MPPTFKPERESSLHLISSLKPKHPVQRYRRSYQRRTNPVSSAPKFGARTRPKPSTSLLAHRSDLTWCASGTTIHTYITYVCKIADPQGPEAMTLLLDAATHVTNNLASAADGPIEGGQQDFSEDGLDLHVENVANHQLTWGVLGSRLWRRWRSICSTRCMISVPGTRCNIPMVYNMCIQR